jgi:hypothetical protein
MTMTSDETTYVPPQAIAMAILLPAHAAFLAHAYSGCVSQEALLPQGGMRVPYPGTGGGTWSAQPLELPQPLVLA